MNGAYQWCVLLEPGSSLWGYCLLLVCCVLGCRLLGPQYLASAGHTVDTLGPCSLIYQRFHCLGFLTFYDFSLFKNKNLRDFLIRLILFTPVYTVVIPTVLIILRPFLPEEQGYRLSEV